MKERQLFMAKLECLAILRGGFVSTEQEGGLDMLIWLVYVGDSATLSFLQVTRTLLEPLCGRCAFIDDPRRHRITEPQFNLTSSSRLSQLLPDHRTAVVLVDAFFINVSSTDSL
jgi:hypothetical protein